MWIKHKRNTEFQRCSEADARITIKQTIINHARSHNNQADNHQPRQDMANMEYLAASGNDRRIRRRRQLQQQRRIRHTQRRPQRRQQQRRQQQQQQQQQRGQQATAANSLGQQRSGLQQQKELQLELQRQQRSKQLQQRQFRATPSLRSSCFCMNSLRAPPLSAELFDEKRASLVYSHERGQGINKIMVGKQQWLQVVDTATAATSLTDDIARTLLYAARLGHTKDALQEIKTKLLDCVREIFASP